MRVVNRRDRLGLESVVVLVGVLAAEGEEEGMYSGN